MSVWQKLGLDIDGEANEDLSGYSVSLSSDGLVVAIGAPGNGFSSGQVRVYRYSNNAWTQLGLDIDGEATYDNSGFSVSLSSDGLVVAIGASGNAGINGAYSGQVRVYRYSNNAWTQLGLDIDGEATFDRSGVSVSLSSDGLVVAIGAPNNAGINGSNSGQVRVYRYSNNVWQKLGQDIDGEAINDNSGHSVSLSSDGLVVAIGALKNNGINNLNLGSGSTRVYRYSNNAWTQLGIDIDGEAGGPLVNNWWETTGDQSGYSVSLSADGLVVAIGAPGNAGTGSNSGQVRVYKFTQVPDLISNICFIAGTPVTTDQGNLPIEKINPLIHTIRNKKIVAITKTVTQDKYLVCFEKDSLGKNIPSQKTIISKNHKLFYNGKMRNAREFLKNFDNVENVVTKVKYTGSALYNVLLEEHDKMMVNNLICETLDPENGVAKVYMALQKLDTAEEKQSLIKKINAHVIKNNVFNKNNGNKKAIK
jgi:hypothetical protein